MKIGIGADHRGVVLKTKIIEFLQGTGYDIIDYGTVSAASVDYPKIGFRLAHDVAMRKMRFGILMCYTGQGMAMTANKVPGVRAAICTTPKIAELTRAHNDANILVLPAGFIRFDKKTRAIIKTFLSTKFEGGRHFRRLKIIKKYERDHIIRDGL
ncbi:MAG: ribose 5-phosphate isomerase B [bacterium]